MVASHLSSPRCLLQKKDGLCLFVAKKDGLCLFVAKKDGLCLFVAQKERNKNPLLQSVRQCLVKASLINQSWSLGAGADYTEDRRVKALKDSRQPPLINLKSINSAWLLLLGAIANSNRDR